MPRTELASPIFTPVGAGAGDPPDDPLVEDGLLRGLVTQARPGRQEGFRGRTGCRPGRASLSVEKLFGRVKKALGASPSRRSVRHAEVVLSASRHRSMLEVSSAKTGDRLRVKDPARHRGSQRRVLQAA
jgi:hypothetical protein